MIFYLIAIIICIFFIEIFLKFKISLVFVNQFNLLKEFILTIKNSRNSQEFEQKYFKLIKNILFNSSKILILIFLVAILLFFIKSINNDFYMNFIKVKNMLIMFIVSFIYTYLRKKICK